jgi:hypothetical protein
VPYGDDIACRTRTKFVTALLKRHCSSRLFLIAPAYRDVLAVCSFTYRSVVKMVINSKLMLYFILFCLQQS